MRYKVLGQVEILNGNNSLKFNRPKVRQLISVLLARPNQMVTADVLIDELWGHKIPRSALTTVQTYVYHARKLLESELCVRDASEILVTRPAGYSVTVADGALDADVFARQVESSRATLAAGHSESALAGLSAALDLWFGPPFTGVTFGPVLSGHVMYLNELRLAAIGLRIEARRDLGRHSELIPELKMLVAENPLNERFHAHLIGSLSECGRRAEALEAYRALWRTLDSELGVRPAPELRRLHQDLLDDNVTSGT